MKIIEDIEKLITQRGIWAIGNIEKINDNGIFFRIGKTTKTTQDHYDDSSKRFIEEDFEKASSTPVIIDTNLEVCGICRKIELAPKSYSIAKKLVKLLNESSKKYPNIEEVKIDPISDPIEIIEIIQKSFVIDKCQIFLSRPNAWDVEKDFVKPYQTALEESNSNKGKAEFEGDNLKKPFLETMARTSASTGSDMKIWSKITKDSKKKPYSLKKKNFISITTEDISDKNLLLQRVTLKYNEIRKKNEKE